MYRHDSVPELGDFDWGSIISEGVKLVEGVVTAKAAPKVTVPKPAAKPGVPKAPAAVSPAAKAAGIGMGAVVLVGAGVAAFLLFRRKGK